MADTLTPEERSRNMAAIRSKGTKPEVYFRKLLFSYGYRYRINVNYIPGHPDLYLRKYNMAVFIHGCFWHRHPGCKYAYTPKTRTEFWQKKFDSNIKRDQTVKRELQDRKIRRLVVWECTVKKMQKSDEYRKEVMQEVTDFLSSDEMNLEI